MSEWVLAHLTRPKSAGDVQPVAFVVVLAMLIGAIDYASGIRISLAVFYLVALPFWSIWNSMSALLMFLVIVWAFSHLLSLFRQLEVRVVERTEALSVAAARRRQLEHDVLMIGSRERNAMGEELHDDICQHLVGTALAAKVLAQRLSQTADPREREAASIVAMVEDGIGRTRRLARGLLLSSIDPAELSEQLNEMATEVSRSGVPCRFVEVGAVHLDDRDVAAQIYRIAQEALRNAQKHARANRIELSLSADERSMCLMVEDDGDGLPAERSTTGMGLKIMANRAAYIGATLSLLSAPPERGTRVICHVPLAGTAA